MRMKKTLYNLYASKYLFTSFIYLTNAIGVFPQRLSDNRIETSFHLTDAKRSKHELEQQGYVNREIYEEVGAPAWRKSELRKFPIQFYPVCTPPTRISQQTFLQARISQQTLLPARPSQQDSPSKTFLARALSQQKSPSKTFVLVKTSQQKFPSKTFLLVKTSQCGGVTRHPGFLALVCFLGISLSLSGDSSSSKIIIRSIISVSRFIIRFHRSRPCGIINTIRHCHSTHSDHSVAFHSTHTRQ